MCGLLLAMPETVQRGAVPFSAVSVLRDFRNVFRNPIFLTGAATLSLSYIPMMSLGGGVRRVILIDAGGDEYFAIRLGAGARIRRR
ncbi:sugar transport protein [Salmonella enterica subsp. arizonae]|uniref:Sugar transport protein n=1 Tax=Salmonella enterica subsp. arizonae TaxID=59203 RepID=A0A379TJH8_SALER|nr:sugar transport protein [Salmonella enterica subsp. arizonae]